MWVVVTKINIINFYHQSYSISRWENWVFLFVICVTKIIYFYHQNNSIYEKIVNCDVTKIINRGGGMSFFPVKHKKFPLSYIQDAKNFSVVKPLNSGEARASRASPVPPPLIIEEAKKNNTVTPNFLTKFPRYHFVRQGPQKSFTSSFWTWTW